MVQKDKGYTTELTDASITITANDGVKKASIFCTTATAGSVTGSESFQGNASDPLPVEQNKSINLTTTEGSAVLDGWTITAPSGCTLQIILMI